MSMEHTEASETDPMGLLIREAFREQAIPPLPKDLRPSTVRIKPPLALATTTHPSGVHLFDRAVAGVLFIGIFAGISVAIWGSGSSVAPVPDIQPKTKPNLDSVSQAPPVDSVKDVDSIHSEPPLLVHESRDAVAEARSSFALEAIESLNLCVTTQTSQANLMAKRWKSILTFDEERQAVVAFEALGVPRGIKNIHHGVSEQQSWLAVKPQSAFTYTVDWQECSSDLRRFVNAAFDDKMIYDEMLDGLRDDPDGPRFDFRAMLKQHFGTQVIVVVDTTKVSDQVILAISLREPKSVATGIDHVMRFQTDASVERFQESNLWIAPTGLVLHVAGDQLLIGHRQLVQDAAARRLVDQ